MALILTRSPYFVSREDLDNDASIKLEIGYYDADEGGFIVDKTYNLAFRNSYLIDVSPLISDFLGDNYKYSSGLKSYFNTLNDEVVYVRITVSGSKNGVLQTDRITENIATNGYLYSTEDYNKDFSTEIRENAYYTGSTDLIYKLDDSNIVLRFLATEINRFGSGGAETLSLVMLSKGDIIYSNQKQIDYDYSDLCVFKIDSDTFSSFRDRVESGSGVLEDNACLDRFFRKFNIQDVDEILLSIDGGNTKRIRVKTVEECKHKPYRVTFRNKYGTLEDLWFFKRSDKTISINKEMFRGNSIGSYNAGNGIKTMQHFNVNGYEKITLNSGFVEEEMNEAFRQLLLSEEITLYDYKENKEYNVNIATSELQYKQHVNDKLINYTIEFEFAHEVINNVG